MDLDAYRTLDLDTFLVKIYKKLKKGYTPHNYSYITESEKKQDVICIKWQFNIYIGLKTYVKLGPSTLVKKDLLDII